MARTRWPPEDSELLPPHPPTTIELISEDDRSVAADSWSIKSEYRSTLDDKQCHIDTVEVLASGNFPATAFDYKLCVIGLAPTHVALREKGGVTVVDYNVGKSDRRAMKVMGKRKRVCECWDDWGLVKNSGLKARKANLNFTNYVKNVNVDVVVHNAQHLEPNSALCKVCANDTFYIVRFVLVRIWFILMIVSCVSK